MPGVNRRGFLAGVAGSAVLSGISAVAGPTTLAVPTQSRSGQPVSLREGTNLAAQLSPDGRRIAIDLLGVLWLVPANGGTATRLTSDLFDIAQPDWSPDGNTLVFQSWWHDPHYVETARNSCCAG